MTTAAREEPANALPAGARTMWTAEAVLRAVLAVAAALTVGQSSNELMPWLPLAAAVGGLAYAAVVPRLRHRRWRWALDDEDVDLIHGVWRVTRTIVPITRIQHVSVQRTGWTNVFGLVRLHVNTAAGTTTIPGLERGQADDVRDRILARLRLPDDL